MLVIICESMRSVRLANPRRTIVEICHRSVNVAGLDDYHPGALKLRPSTSCHIPPVDYVEVLGSTGSKEAILNYGVFR
jgi:hypothetical protein